MRFQLGPASRAEMQGLHPFLIQIIERAITLTNQDFRIHDGLRTAEEQRRLVQRGASKTMDSRHRVQADGFGHAFDAVPLINGKLRWEWPPIYQIAAAVADAERALKTMLATRPVPGGSLAGTDMNWRLRWGGVWDRPLGELGRTPEDMKRAVNAYVDRRRKLGRTAFIDGPHFELMR